MRTASRSLLTLATLLVSTLVTPLCALPGDDAVSLQFSIYAWNGDVAPLSYGPNRKVELVEAFTRSEIQDYSGPAVLNFTLFGSESPQPDSQKPKPVVASVTLPQGVSKITLLTARTAQGKYRIYAIPEDGDSLPEGSIKLHNVSPRNLMVVYNQNSRLELASGSSSVIEATGAAMLLRVAHFHNGRWRELFNNIATLNSDRRQNILLVPGESGNGVSMYTLPSWPVRTTPVPEPTDPSSS